MFWRKKKAAATPAEAQEELAVRVPPEGLKEPRKGEEPEELAMFAFGKLPSPKAESLDGLCVDEIGLGACLWKLGSTDEAPRYNKIRIEF